MNDSGKSLEGKTKRELVATLDAVVAAWDGASPLGRERENCLNAISTLLARCPLWLAERSWLDLSELWLCRAARQPDAWLREMWLGTLAQWRRYIDECVYEPDGLPVPVERACRQPELIDINPDNRPGHLPFGFVKPWM